jgi:hypothetical protein
MKRRTWRFAARNAAAVLVAAGVAISVAACSGSHSPAVKSGSPPAAIGSSSPSTSATNSPLAYSQCMRAHQVPNFPDPDTSGQVPKVDPQQLGVSSADLQAAQRTCHPTLPTGGPDQQQEQQCFLAGACPPALVQQILTQQRQYARCMRSHGVPTFPDPTIDAQGRPVFDVSRAGLTSDDTHSSTFEAKDHLCERLVSGSSGGVPVPLA